MLIEYVNKWGTDKSTLGQLPILFYEMGDLSKAIVYRARYPQDAPGYTIEAKLALADMIAQIIIVCERENWDYEQIRKLGIARCIEKITRHIEEGE